MTARSLKIQKLITLFILGVIFYCTPFFSLFNVDKEFLGVPVLYLYLFISWGLLITLTAFVIEFPRMKSLNSSK
ncbi:MAG: hypothetical protein D6748_07795 [Calditrichaeota bacterium]|nr:MAG: hypothetical protein D6748_07795 [Calditrichota bacterium]